MEETPVCVFHRATIPGRNDEPIERRGKGLIVFFDELIGFIYSFNKYRSGADEQMWTQLFAGGGVTVNRVGADPVKINDTCIGVFGGIQPEILVSFAKGKIQNGFVDRWLSTSLFRKITHGYYEKRYR